MVRSDATRREQPRWHEQAATVASTVKALAELLTSTGTSTRQGLGRNFYQGIFGEMYRRFGVSSYKHIRIEQYDLVLRFLEDWRVAAMRGEWGETTEQGSLF